MVVTTEQFRKLNILAGTARALEQKALTPSDNEIFNRDFDLLVEKLMKVDTELGENLGAEKEFYLAVCQIAKGYFNDKPFGGLKCATGQFGMSLIHAQHLKDNPDGTQTNYHSWRRTITTDTGNTDADIFGGTTGDEWAYAESTSEQKEVIAWHTLISYLPDPRLVLIELNVNDYPYTPWCVEPFSKITKPDKLFKLIPMPGRVVIHPGGKFYIRGWFDLQLKTVPILTTDIDVELGLFGLTFAEFTQLAVANLI